ncbi:CLUMA_CG005880, isoform A [Clunio marinus]|uniref:CLUMA_CG005880, isoform A n=1 Tax=Clunio marinus TaxID=568069 RepID=A0A1J1I0D5_9DIPT|nr:CLUMA_CG005880, isoform A [Clunio marinus]
MKLFIARASRNIKVPRTTLLVYKGFRFCSLNKNTIHFEKDIMLFVEENSLGHGDLNVVVIIQTITQNVDDITLLDKLHFDI